MFVIELVYKASLEEIDAHMAAHVRFLKKYYAAGGPARRQTTSKAASSRHDPRRLASGRTIRQRFPGKRCHLYARVN
jgi:uncharacterized protein YciI